MNPIRGRGASWNPENRFDGRAYEAEEDAFDLDDPPPRLGTVYLEDRSQSILSKNDSPDVPFTYSINPYRGCEHGCVYCYARPTHEYLGYSAGLDFETKILVKHQASALLREALSHPKWEAQPIALSGVTDPYQPAERKYRLTRACLEVFRDLRNPTGIVTKNHAVVRDMDVLRELAGMQLAAVYLSVTTLDLALNRKLEPRSSSPGQRLEAIRRLAEVGVPVGVLVAPVIPGLTDHEIPGILQAARDAGASFASYILLRLPHAVAPLFDRWLEEHYPLKHGKVLSRIRSLREGKLNDAQFGTRMRGQGAFAEQVESLFRISCQKARYEAQRPSLATHLFRRPGGEQLELL